MDDNDVLVDGKRSKDFILCNYLIFS